MLDFPFAFSTLCSGGDKMKHCRKCKCNLEKSNPKWGWLCLNCQREYRRNWARKRRILGLPTSGKRPPKEWWTKYNKEYLSRPEVKKRKAEQMREYRKNPELRFRMEARRITRMAVKRGKLFKTICSKCGNPNTQAHHVDYNKPLIVVWLCVNCHKLEHAKAEGK